MSSKKTNWKRIDETIRAYLGLKHHLVGVKIRKKDIQEEEKRLKPEKPLAYCHMVRIASQHGKTFLYDKTDEACPTAEFILGFREPKYSKIEYRIEPSDTKSILIAPLDQMAGDPDVIIATVTPKQMMDLTTILQAGKAELLSAWFKGEAACAEFTAKPYMEHEPNLSFLCNGARVVYSDFRDAEILFGAPAHTYIHVAETMNRISKTGGALCGCRTSDIPMEIINEFEKAGFSKGTDYFFGKISGQNFRAYLNKDFQGRLKFITFHLPVKLTSAEETEEVAKKLQKTLIRPYSVNQRDYWLDLTMTATEAELAMDLRDGESIKKVAQEFANKMKRYLNRIGIKA